MKLNWNQIIASLMVGLLVGAAAGKLHSRKHHHLMRGSEKRYAHMLERFTARLQLTPDQKMRVGALLEDKRRKIEALRAETRPKFGQIRKSTRDEIRKLLTPGQQAKFDEMTAEWERRKARWEKSAH